MAPNMMTRRVPMPEPVKKPRQFGGGTNGVAKPNGKLVAVFEKAATQAGPDSDVRVDRLMGALVAELAMGRPLVDGKPNGGGSGKDGMKKPTKTYALPPDEQFNPNWSYGI